MVAGDVVNTTSRLQEVAPVGGVVVGEITHRATEHIIEYAPLDPVAVKGKAEPVPTWRAKGALGPHWTEGSLRPPGRNRLGLAFDCDGIEGCVLDDVLRGSVRDLSDDDAAHGRHFLKAGGRVDHVPGDHALALLRPSRKRDDSLARVHRRPYSQVEPRTLVVELLDPVEDA